MKIVLVLDVDYRKLCEKVDPGGIRGVSIEECLKVALDNIKDLGVKTTEIIGSDNDIYSYLYEEGSINKAITDQKVGNYIVKLLKDI